MSKNGREELIGELWRQRGQQKARSNRAEDAGFPGTARKAAAEADRLEARIRELEGQDDD